MGGGYIACAALCFANVICACVLLLMRKLMPEGGTVSGHGLVRR